MSINRLLHINPEARLPLVQQLTQQLTWLIASEVIKEGEQLPPIRDLSQALGIHFHTVRAAYLRLQSLELVTVRPKLGTVVLPVDPTHLAAETPSNPSFLFGVLLPEPSPTYHGFVEAIHRASLKSHWLPIVHFNFDDPHQVERALRQLVAIKIDGLIITSAWMEKPFFEMLEASPHISSVYVDTPQVTENSLVPDTAGAAYKATKHLLDHGHQNVALLSAPLDWENVTPCLSGYAQAHSNYGKSYKEDLVIETEGFSREAGFNGTSRLLNRTPRPAAIFAAADILALGAMEAIHEAGLLIPDDIALASYNDTAAAALVSPPLTSATFPAPAMALKAVDLLISLMGGAAPLCSPMVFESELVIRQSCGCHK